MREQGERVGKRERASDSRERGGERVRKKRGRERKQRGREREGTGVPAQPFHKVHIPFFYPPSWIFEDCLAGAAEGWTEALTPMAE